MASAAPATSGEKHHGYERRDDRRRSDHHDAPEMEERVSKPSGPLCPFCYHHHAKAQCSLSMCPDCLALDHRHWNCPKKQCHGCYEYGQVTHCCPDNPKGEFYDTEYLSCVAAGAAPAVQIPNVFKIPVPSNFVPYWERER